MSSATTSTPILIPSKATATTILRLPPNTNLLSELKAHYQILQSRSRLSPDIRKPITGGYIITAVGSLYGVTIRLANASNSSLSKKNNDVLKFPASTKFELLSFVGTFDVNGDSHIHLSLGDETGNVKGGHYISGMTNTTVEIVMGVVTKEGCTLERTWDEDTGYKELAVFPTCIGGEEKEGSFFWGRSGTMVFGYTVLVFMASVVFAKKVL